MQQQAVSSYSGTDKTLLLIQVQWIVSHVTDKTFVIDSFF
jgi:hypothetical protein